MRRLRHPLVLIVAAAALLVTGFSVASAAGDGPSPAATPPVPALPPPGAGGTRAINRPATYDLSYVAIAPCRVLDTRGHGGAMANAERTFKVVGDLRSQGGGQTCGIPADARSVALTLTGISSGGSTGYVRGRKASGPVATTSVVNFSPALSASNTYSQPVSGSGMQLKTFGTAHLVGDVLGYYTEQIEGMVAQDGSIYNGTSHLVSAHKNSTGNYTVTLDRDVTYCTPTVTGYSGYVYASAYTFEDNKVQVYVWYLSGSTQTAYDTYFYLHVSC